MQSIMHRPSTTFAHMLQTVEDYLEAKAITGRHGNPPSRAWSMNVYYLPIEGAWQWLYCDELIDPGLAFALRTNGVLEYKGADEHQGDICERWQIDAAKLRAYLAEVK